MQIQSNYSTFNSQSGSMAFKSRFAKTEALKDTLKEAETRWGNIMDQDCFNNVGYRRKFVNAMRYLLNNGKDNEITLNSLRKGSGDSSETFTSLKENGVTLYENCKFNTSSSFNIGKEESPLMDMVIDYANKDLGGQPNPYEKFSNEEVNAILANFVELVNNSSTYDAKFINKMVSMPRNIRNSLDRNIRSEVQKIEKMIFGE